MKKDKKQNHELSVTPSSDSVSGNPETAFEMINKYGTYEIQPTNDSDNSFPKIGQGLADKEYRKDD